MRFIISQHYKKLKNAIEYIEKGTLIAKKAYNKYLLFLGLNIKGIYYMSIKDFVKALNVFKEYDKLHDPNQSNYLTNKLNIASCLLQLDSLDKALNYIIPTLNKIPIETNHDKYAHWSTYNDLIEYFIKRRNFVMAKKYLLKVKEYRDYGEPRELYAQFEYEIEKGLGNYKVAIETLERHQNFVLEDANKNNTDGIKSQIALHEKTEKLQKAELEKLRSENTNQNQLRWFWIIINILCLLLSIYVVRTNKLLRTTDESLIKKNTEISSALLQGQTLERKRGAADLHDNLGTTMSSLIWTLDAIDSQKLQPNEQTVYQNLKKMVVNAYNEVRLLPHNPLPEEFEKQELPSTLQYFVRKINQNSKIKLNLQIDENVGKLDKKVEFELIAFAWSWSIIS